MIHYKMHTGEVVEVVETKRFKETTNHYVKMVAPHTFMSTEELPNGFFRRKKVTLPAGTIYPMTTRELQANGVRV